MCKLEFVRLTAASNSNMPTTIPAKPMACIRMRPNRGTIQTPSMKPISKKIDKCATLCESKVARGQSMRASGEFDRSQDCRRKQYNAVRGNINQKPGNGSQLTACPIRAGKHHG